MGFVGFGCRLCPSCNEGPAGVEVSMHMLASASKDGIAVIWRLTESREADAAIDSTTQLKIHMLRKSGGYQFRQRVSSLVPD